MLKNSGIFDLLAPTTHAGNIPGISLNWCGE